MNNYELMVIFTPVLSDEDFKAEQNNQLQKDSTTSIAVAAK